MQYWTLQKRYVRHSWLFKAAHSLLLPLGKQLSSLSSKSDKYNRMIEECNYLRCATAFEKDKRLICCVTCSLSPPNSHICHTAALVAPPATYFLLESLWTLCYAARISSLICLDQTQFTKRKIRSLSPNISFSVQLMAPSCTHKQSHSVHFFPIRSVPSSHVIKPRLI